MALSSYYRQYDNQNLAELERQKEALRQMSETQKQLVNENADASIKQIQETGNAEIRSAEHAYDGVINTANVQKLINERQIAERMANLGLTDSGLNRTQQTAIQVSHANQVNNAQVARQRQIDALALAINQQIGQVNIQRTNDLTNLDLSYEQNIYNADEQYRANRDSWASAQYKADQEAAAARYKAKLDYDAEIAKLNEEAEVDIDETKQTDRNNLIKNLNNKSLSKKTKQTYVDEYISKYGLGQDNVLYNVIQDAGVYYMGSMPEKIGTTDEISLRNKVRYYLDNWLPKRAKTKEDALKYVEQLYDEDEITVEEAEYITRQILSQYK
jgi:hypothetical protein